MVRMWYISLFGLYRTGRDASGADQMGGFPTDQTSVHLGRFDECRNGVRRLFENSAEPKAFWYGNSMASSEPCRAGIAMFRVVFELPSMCRYISMTLGCMPEKIRRSLSFLFSASIFCTSNLRSMSFRFASPLLDASRCSSSWT